jgi:hypothetical protein
MQPEREDRVAVRREMMDLLRQQVEALDSPLGLTDEKLRECYERQARVQALRDKLQAGMDTTAEEIPASAAEAAETSLDRVA